MEFIDPDVLILGGGFAGLAAASILAGRGSRVIVLEKRPGLGGRARSFHDPRAEQVVDNGQHLFMGCYRHTRTFLRRIGSEALLDFPREIKVHYADASGSRARLSCPSWIGAPYHLLAGVLRLKGLSLRDKWGLGRVASWVKARGLNGNSQELDRVTVSGWLDSLGQSAALKERFHFPIALGALNEDPRRASALGYVQVLREIFFSGTQASRLGLSKVGLSELYTAQAKDYIEARGGRVLCGARASAVRCADSLLVETERGESFRARAVISSLAPWDLARLELPAPLNTGAWRDLKPSPIVGINLWLDRQVLKEPFVGMLGTEVQWAFNRSRLWGMAAEGQVLALVISGAHRQADMDPQDIFAAARRDLESCFPAAKKAKITRWTVVKEPFATLSPVPGTDALRPGHRTEVPGFYLAGDWTQTGLPATIESAVKSGHSAAELAGERQP